MLLCILANAAERAAVITLVKGTVEVQKSGENSWKKAAVKMELKVNDKVSTKKGSRCELALDDGTVLKLRENSLMQINEMSEENETRKKSSVLKLITGKLWAKAEPQGGSKFEVVTPAAIVGIRGTEFAIIVLLDGGSEVLVFKGSVEIKTLQEAIQEIKTTLVEAGKALGIKASGEEGFVRELTPQEQQDWQKFIEGKKIYIINPVTDDERDGLKKDIAKAKKNFFENRKFAYAVRDADLSAGKTVLDHEKRVTRVQQYLMRPSPTILRFLNLNFRPGQTEQWAFHYWQNDWYFTNPLPPSLIGMIASLADPRANILIKRESLFANNAPDKSRDELLIGWDVNYNQNEGNYFKFNKTPISFDVNHISTEGEPQIDLVLEMSDQRFSSIGRVYFTDGTAGTGVAGTMDLGMYIINNAGNVLGAGNFQSADASKLFEWRNNINFEMVLDLRSMSNIKALKNGGVIDVVIIPDIIYAGIDKILGDIGQIMIQFENQNTGGPSGS